MKTKLLIISCYIIAMIFTAFAALQYNDPDPYVWMPIYLIVVAISLLVPFVHLPKMLLWFVAGCYLVGAYYLWPGTYKGITMPMSSYQPEIELARESLGLMISFFAVIYLSLIKLEKHSKQIN